MPILPITESSYSIIKTALLLIGDQKNTTFYRLPKWRRSTSTFSS